MGPIIVNERLKMWTKGVPVENAALAQLRDVASLPIVHGHVAAMPDVHFGIGATVGSVIPTLRAVIPAAVGVDIGCGMMARRLDLTAADLPDGLYDLRMAIEAAVPVGKASHGDDAPREVRASWSRLADGLERIQSEHPKVSAKDPALQIGTLGGGNHFIELCLDEADGVWVMLHSGSRGIGNRIGGYFIERAREEMTRLDVKLPNRDLAYLTEGTSSFNAYVEAVEWAQRYAMINRETMMVLVLRAIEKALGRKVGVLGKGAVNCHHNYVSRERHLGQDVFLTRKGAVSAREGELGIIPGSMGARSFIVRGKGNPESFHSCSHGAGRVMSRGAAKERFTVEEHEAATRGVECRKDIGVIDETPGAYKDIDAVMAAQADLVEIVHTLKQFLCVKG